MKEKELVNKIKQLSVTLSDKAIGKRLNLSKDQVYRLRKKNKIFRKDNFSPSFAAQVSNRKSVIRKKKTLILTGWELRIKPNANFIKIINNIAQDQDADKMCAVLNPADISFLPKIIEDNFQIATEDFDVTKHLQFIYVPTHALATIPTQNFKSFSNKSVIIPGLVIDMQTLPSMNLPKMVATTGSIGTLSAYASDYEHINDDHSSYTAFIKRWSQLTSRSSGAVYSSAKHYTKPTALIIDIDEETGYFHPRYITMNKTDRVYDLNKVYYADGRIEKNIPKALVLSDIHEINKDQIEFDKSMEMIDYFQSEETYLNDFFDAASCNPHEINSAAKRVNFPDIDAEADSGRNTLIDICKRSKKVNYIQSNHCNFVTRWLDSEANWHYARNYITALELQLFRLKDGRHPIVKLLDMDSIPNLEFISEAERKFVGEVLVRHGHETISGKRAGFYEQVKLYGSLVIGHYHNYRQWRNGAQVGKMIRSDIEYAAGSTGSWIASNVLIQPDDSLQGLFIIDGRCIVLEK